METNDSGNLGLDDKALQKAYINVNQQSYNHTMKHRKCPQAAPPFAVDIRYVIKAYLENINKEK